MRRREFIAILGGATAARPFRAGAQSAVGRTIGVLWPGVAPPAPPRMDAFRRGLQQAGFVEGKNVAIDLRHAQGGLQQLPALAAELVRRNVDIIATFGDYAPKVVQRATETIPIVVVTDDILGAGIVASLARPGGNTTGLTILAPELTAKRLEVLSEIVPGLSRVAAIWDPTTGASQVAEAETAARTSKAKLQVLQVRHRDDLVGAFRAASENRAEALTVFASPFLASLGPEIIGLAAEHRLPAIYQWKEHVEAVGLVSYGTSLVQMWRQAAIIVAKILKGAKPADLPVEQPLKFELALNLRTASALGLEIPPSLLVRADEVIE